MTKTIFKKNYYTDTLNDVERDISEILQYSNTVNELTEEQLLNGRFEITIKFTTENDNAYK